MTISKKIKKADNKIEQNKTQYGLDTKSTKISALLSRNFSKYEFLISKDVLTEKKLARKSCYNQKN